MKRIAILVVGLIISIASLYLALQGFHLDELWDATAKVQIGFFVLMVVPYILTFMTKVWRWRVLLHPDEKRFRTGTLFSSLMISYVPLPFRMGEVARGVVLSARTDTPAARVFSTILVEKVLDVLTLLLFLGISLPFVGLPSSLQGSATAFGAIFLVVALVLLVLVMRPDWVRKLVGVLVARLPARLGPRIKETTEHVLDGLAPLSNPPIAVKLVLWSLATWGVNSVTIYLMLLSFNISVPPMAAVVLVVATNLGMAVPSAPGYIGTFELVVVSVLRVLGIAETEAQTFALFYHFVGLVPVALIGVISVLQQGVGFAAFTSSDSKGPQAGQEPPRKPPVTTQRVEQPRDLEVLNGSSTKTARPVTPQGAAPTRDKR